MSLDLYLMALTLCFKLTIFYINTMYNCIWLYAVLYLLMKNMPYSKPQSVTEIFGCVYDIGVGKIGINECAQ